MSGPAPSRSGGSERGSVRLGAGPLLGGARGGLRSQVFDVFRDVNDGAWVLFQGKDQRRRGRPPVVRGMIVAREDEALEALKRLRAQAVPRHFELRGPDNRVED